jgi:hypothetical protein
LLQEDGTVSCSGGNDFVEGLAIKDTPGSAVDSERDTQAVPQFGSARFETAG